MSRLRHIILALIVFAFVACDKAPDAIISEKKMARLMADLSVAEAYVEARGNEFTGDSSKLVLKQSVMAKHGVTAEQYDHSLAWYAHNIDVYIEVCDKAAALLEEQQNKSEKNQNNAIRQSQARKTFAVAGGDTTDLWKQQRQWLLTGGMQNGSIAWVERPADRQQGKRYEWILRFTGLANLISITLVADYDDGGITTITRMLDPNGPQTIALQTDSTRHVSRVAGYLTYEMRPGQLLWVDSVQLQCTRLNPAQYGDIAHQNTSERNSALRNLPSVNTMPDQHAQRDIDDNEARAQSVKQSGHFTPKEGVNKSNRSRHIDSSPNAAHLPNKH
ncbi:MAG: DUF4296 domain-containing protein [Muribaculaceae bacterium]|nr:DUF4296 domain-containing protein [Muribaculaceae bacterium]